MVARHSVATLFFDDLTLGDEWESPARTVTESDVVAFAGLSGDYNPIHVDHESCKEGAFGHPIAHGLLGLAFVSGLGSASPRVDTMAFLAILEWEFVRPIAFGDTVHVLSRVESIEPRSRGRRAEVIWHRALLNQRGEVVQQGRTRTLVRGRAALPPPAAGDRTPES
ncbi:MaoC family dehydratase [Tundrisphaera sp. TA3]|uniref:MaoC family dehydratase n=1 Tax=Tundrisphaera sp. TA3 TaxID=3435775 RepID=UPI003EBFC1F8